MSVEHHIERQKNAITFAIFFLKTVVLLTAGSAVAVLALIGDLHNCGGPLLIAAKSTLPFLLLSVFYALMACYCGYWSELLAYNALFEKEPNLKDSDYFFTTGHVLILIAGFVYFAASFRFVSIL